MQWDLGLQGLAVLGAMSLGFGALAGLLVAGDARQRLVATAIATFACFGVGLVASEVLFGWATEEELQPNVDGLSRDEVFLSSVLTTGFIVLVLRSLAHGPRTRASRQPHSAGRRLDRGNTRPGDRDVRPWPPGDLRSDARGKAELERPDGVG